MTRYFLRCKQIKRDGAIAVRSLIEEVVMSCLQSTNLETLETDQHTERPMGPVLVANNRRAMDRVSQVVNDAVDAALANGNLPA